MLIPVAFTYYDAALKANSNRFEETLLLPVRDVALRPEPMLSVISVRGWNVLMQVFESEDGRFFGYQADDGINDGTITLRYNTLLSVKHHRPISAATATNLKRYLHKRANEARDTIVSTQFEREAMLEEARNAANSLLLLPNGYALYEVSKPKIQVIRTDSGDWKVYPYSDDDYEPDDATGRIYAWEDRQDALNFVCEMNQSTDPFAKQAIAFSTDEPSLLPKPPSAQYSEAP